MTTTAATACCCWSAAPRRRLLQYLARTDIERYRALIGKLGLRR